MFASHYAFPTTDRRPTVAVIRTEPSAAANAMLQEKYTLLSVRRLAITMLSGHLVCSVIILVLPACSYLVRISYVENNEMLCDNEQYDYRE
jgi:hypothetical protein